MHRRLRGLSVVGFSALLALFFGQATVLAVPTTATFYACVDTT